MACFSDLICRYECDCGRMTFFNEEDLPIAMLHLCSTTFNVNPKTCGIMARDANGTKLSFTAKQQEKLELTAEAFYACICDAECGGGSGTGGPGEPPTDVSVTNDCDSPVGVEICNLEDLVQIDGALAPLGCVIENDVKVGVVFLCKLTDAEGVSTFKKVYVPYDGDLDEDYTGPWSECPEVETIDTFLCQS